MFIFCHTTLRQEVGGSWQAHAHTCAVVHNTKFCTIFVIAAVCTCGEGKNWMQFAPHLVSGSFLFQKRRVFLWHVQSALFHVSSFCRITIDHPIPPPIVDCRGCGAPFGWEFRQEAAFLVPFFSTLMFSHPPQLLLFHLAGSEARGAHPYQQIWGPYGWSHHRPKRSNIGKDS